MRSETAKLLNGSTEGSILFSMLSSHGFRVFALCLAFLGVVAIPEDELRNSTSLSNVSLVRVRRQERLLCLGNEFISNFLQRLVDANRQSLRDSEPIKLGDAANIGILDLKNGNAYGVANVFFQVSSDGATLEHLLDVLSGRALRHRKG